MLGHQPLIAMRRAGAMPDMVFVETSPELYASTEDWPEESPSRAQVRVTPNDPVHRLDLRFLIGLKVWVTGTDADRVFAVAEACHRHQVARVIASVTRFDDIGQAETVEITDTRGDLTWPIC